MTRQAWTAVALSVDVEAGSAVPVILDGSEVVVWRSASGSLQAWEDRCPHRGMRLSFGFVRGERLACLYHGWRYDTEAACTTIPAHPDLTPPRTICANAYGCVETGGFIFVRLSETDVLPPHLPEATPVRSTTILATLADLAARLGCDPQSSAGSVEAAIGRLIVALQPIDEGRTCLHVAISGPADAAARRAAAEWSEDIRRRAEGTVPLPDAA